MFFQKFLSQAKIVQAQVPGKLNVQGICSSEKVKVFEKINAKKVEGKRWLITIPFMISALFLNAQTNFTLTTPARTSAGIYEQDGTLIRTLWNNVQKDAGSHQVRWDGTNDDSSIAPSANYNIKVLTNNVNYQWEGVIGNTSASFTGADIHKGYLRMYSMCITGNTAYYSNYYNEGHSSQFRFSLSNPQTRTEILSYGQSSFYSATDGKTVYWAGDDVLGGHNNWFVFGTNVSDDAETGFATGQSYAVQFGRTYSSVISLSGDPTANITGIAVQKNGNYLFVSRQNFNTVDVLDKTTGAFIRALTIPAANRLAVDANDNLWIVSANGINKCPVNADGTLGPVLASITGVAQAWAIAVSPDNSTVTIADGAANQQVKGYSNSDGSLLWTYGQAGGYSTGPGVTNDKFYFDDQRHNNDGSFIAYQPDGSFWVEDAGNYRAQHYTAGRNFIDRIMYMPAFYGTSADPNDPSRVFADLLEFKTNYSLPLAPNNGSWSLANNWGYSVTPEYTYKEGLRSVTTLSNGRTYALIKHFDKYAVLELTSTGIRYTGVETTNFANQIQKDGSLLEWGGGPVGQPFGAGVHLLTAFDPSGNPTWGGGLSDNATTEPMIASDPYALGSGNVVKTSSGVYVGFDAGLPPNSSTDFHLGGFRNDHWTWKTAKSTYAEYSGPFPDDGYYDIGNGVIYAGSMVAALDNAVVWGYHGEFWKGGQCNFYNHVNFDGLSIGQFGTGTGTYAPPGLAGNSTALAMVKDANGNGYLYHNDESVHGGLHRWKITGLNTIAEQVIPIDADFVRTDENPELPGVDLMAGLPFNSFLPDAFGWQNSNSNVFDGDTLPWWYAKTNNFAFHKRKSPDVYITFHQNDYLTRSITRDLVNDGSLTSWKLSGVINYNNSLPDGPGGVIYLEVLDNNDRVIARLNHEVIFGVDDSQTTNMYGNQYLIHTDQSDSFSTILWKDQPVEISAGAGGITFKYANFAPVTAPLLDPASDWQFPKKMRVYISGGGGYDRRLELISMRFIPDDVAGLPVVDSCESTPVQVYSASSITGNQAYKGELGMEFIVNNPAGILIKQLGAFDDGGNGITGLQPGGSVRVAVFNRSIHTIVPGLDVMISGMADAYIGNHRMKNITPVILPTGDYVIVAKGYHPGEKNGNSFSGGEPFPAADNGGGAITLGNETSYGSDDPNGFNYPATAGNFGNSHIFEAGTFVFTTTTLCASSNQANLSNLILSEGTLAPSFAKTITSYSASVANSVVSVTVTPTAADENATISVNGTLVANKTESGPITLVEGNSIISVVITGGDGTTSKTYTINVTKAGTPTCESSPAQAYIAGIQKGNQAHRGELGMEFIVNNPAGIIVKQLGAFDDGGNGITGLQPGGGVRVAIFNRSTHAIVPGLDVTIIGNADHYTGNHRMKDINPVTLPPGDYVIVAKGYHEGERNGNSFEGAGPFPVGDNGSGAISFGNETSYGPDDPNGFNYPTNAGDFGNPHVFLAGTFDFTKVISCDGGCELPVAQAYIANTTKGNQAHRGELGMEFIVNNAGGIIVDQLGAFDDGGNGITGLQPRGGVRVAIFNRTTHNIVPGLDATIIGNADHYTGNHRMNDIIPVTLPPGDYVIVAKGYHAGEKNGNSLQGGGPFPVGDTGGGAITFGNETSYGPDDPDGFNYPNAAINLGTSPIYLAGTFNFKVDITCPGAQAATAIDLIKQPVEGSSRALTVQGKGLKLYPNPSKGQFTLQLPGVTASKLNIQVLNSNGKLIVQKTIEVTTKTSSLNIPFNLADQPPGIYLVKVESPGGIQTGRIVIVR